MGVGLGVEEDLGVDAAVRRQPLEIGHRQVVEIRPRLQHRGPGIIDVEEVLQAAEVIGRAHGLHRGEGNGHPVASGEREHQLRLQRPLDVQVQLGLGQAADEVGEAVGRHVGLSGDRSGLSPQAGRAGTPA